MIPLSCTFTDWGFGFGAFPMCPSRARPPFSRSAPPPRRPQQRAPGTTWVASTPGRADGLSERPPGSMVAGNNGAFCFIQTERSSRGRGFFFIFIKNSPPCRRPPPSPRAAGDAPSAAGQGLGARGAAPAAASGSDPCAEGEAEATANLGAEATQGATAWVDAAGAADDGSSSRRRRKQQHGTDAAERAMVGMEWQQQRVEVCSVREDIPKRSSPRQT